MSLSDKFPRKHMNDEEMIARMIATAACERSLSPEAKILHDTMSSAAVFNGPALTHTFTIPSGAKPEVVKEVLNLIDISSDPNVKVLIVSELPRTEDLASVTQSKALKGFINTLEPEIRNLPAVRALLKKPDGPK